MLLAAFFYTSPALATWGEMVWGALAGPPAVPSMQEIGLGLLQLGLVGLTIRGLRPRATLGRLALASVFGAAGLAEARGVTIPNTFADGPTALVSEVNAKFETLAAPANASDCATEADVVCDPALSRPGCRSFPSSETLGSYNQGFTELPAPRFEHQGTPPEKSTS